MDQLNREGRNEGIQDSVRGILAGVGADTVLILKICEKQKNGRNNACFRPYLL